MEKQELLKYFEQDLLKVYVIPNSSNEEMYYDINKQKVVVKLKEKPVDNLANIMLVKMIKKKYGINVSIHKGLHSRDKILIII